MHLFSGATADEVWNSAAKSLLADDDFSLEDSRNGPVRDLGHAALIINEPRQRWVLSRVPAMNPAFAIVEAYWILSGRDDSRLVNRWNPSLPKFAGSTDAYSGAYGNRLRNGFGLDQIERAIDSLSNNKSSRQVVLQIWDPSKDFPGLMGKPSSSDVPCNTASFLRVKDGKLHWLQTLRSNDLNRGTPYNFVQFTILHEFIAGCLGVELGPFSHVCSSLHVYQNDLSMFSLTGGTSLRSRTILSLPRKEASEVLIQVEKILDELSSPNLTKKQYRNLTSSFGLPDGHRNVVAISAADIARRNGWPDGQHSAEALCDDDLLSAVWDRWNARWEERRSASSA